MIVVKLSPQDISSLQKSNQDPEVRPGLFEGDIAMSNEVSFKPACEKCMSHP